MLIVLYSFLTIKNNTLLKYRKYILYISIIFIGFLKGEFLSFYIFSSWFSGNIHLGILFVTFLLSMIAAIFFDKNIYCAHICPFGAAQEIVGKIKSKKIKIGKNIMLGLKLLQKIIVFVFIISIVLRVDIKISELEPFTIFLYKSVSITVVIMTALILLASVFIPKPWCTYLCPTGYALKFFQKSHMKNVKAKAKKVIINNIFNMKK